MYNIKWIPDKAFGNDYALSKCKPPPPCSRCAVASVAQRISAVTRALWEAVSEGLSRLPGQLSLLRFFFAKEMKNPTSPITSYNKKLKTPSSHEKTFFHARP